MLNQDTTPHPKPPSGDRGDFALFLLIDSKEKPVFRERLQAEAAAAHFNSHVCALPVRLVP